ncbi:hypothetical protein AVEN_75678-1 [Araneus ventricosus]|uniref:Transposable element Tc1 transposase n=1 Tax=Araneus ventricosus TaxID=182803 RepID=A0A4Y2D6Y8_ARAVE|nr:hypothetical protein AVEN_75678-1 [Araneus ventricosus]
MKANTCRLIRMGYSGNIPMHSFRPQVPDSNNEAWGGNVMVWGCASRLSTGPLRRIQRIMDKLQYEDLLETPCVRMHAVLLVMASFSNRIMIRSTDPSTSRTDSPAVM